jgi:hypothetical protein
VPTVMVDVDRLRTTAVIAPAETPIIVPVKVPQVDPRTVLPAGRPKPVLIVSTRPAQVLATGAPAALRGVAVRVAAPPDARRWLDADLIHATSVPMSAVPDRVAIKAPAPARRAATRVAVPQRCVPAHRATAIVPVVALGTTPATVADGIGTHDQMIGPATKVAWERLPEIGMVRPALAPVGRVRRRDRVTRDPALPVRSRPVASAFLIAPAMTVPRPPTDGAPLPPATPLVMAQGPADVRRPVARMTGPAAGRPPRQIPVDGATRTAMIGEPHPHLALPVTPLALPVTPAPTAVAPSRLAAIAAIGPNEAATHRTGNPARAARAGRPVHVRAAADRSTGSRSSDRTSAARERIVMPAVPAGVDPSMLDAAVRADLRSLAPETSESVALQLVAAGLLVDDEPVKALVHARAARSIAARVGAVREAVGVAAYHAQEWTEALAELRAARRISGDPRWLAVMADCERALGRPERALKALDDPDLRRLDAATQVEVLIVVAGARRDMGQLDAALQLLERGGLNQDKPQPGSARLWYTYADTLSQLGREDEAREWFGVVAAMPDDETDAAERAGIDQVDFEYAEGFEELDHDADEQSSSDA